MRVEWPKYFVVGLEIENITRYDFNHIDFKLLDCENL